MELREYKQLFESALQTKTPEFKKWFRRSKVVRGGKPLLVYHGTNADFKKFDPNLGRKWASKVGFWFCDDSDFAEMFGDSIMPVYIRLEKPFVITQEVFNDWRSEYARKEDWWIAEKKKWISSGHDGLFIEPSTEVFGKLTVRNAGVYAVFHPTQIKSAIANSGKFNPNSNNIMESKLVESKTITAYHGSNVPIKKFDKQFSAQGVFWFSENLDTITGGRSGAVSTKYIMKVQLKVNKTAGWDEYNKYFLQELEQKGYDSIHLDENWVIFDTRNIKILEVKER